MTTDDAPRLRQLGVRLRHAGVHDDLKKSVLEIAGASQLLLDDLDAIAEPLRELHGSGSPLLREMHASRRVLEGRLMQLDLVMERLKAWTIECPCCGDVGAVSDANGFFWDGQPQWCGCDGQVSCDSETEPWINNDCPCEGEGSDHACEWPAVYVPERSEYLHAPDVEFRD